MINRLLSSILLVLVVSGVIVIGFALSHYKPIEVSQAEAFIENEFFKSPKSARSSDPPKNVDPPKAFRANEVFKSPKSVRNGDPPKSVDPPPSKGERMGPPLPKRVFLKQVEESRRGFGQVKNYTTLGILFAPQYRTGHYLPMIDFKVNNINSLCKTNTYGTSLGFVSRYVPKSSCWMWGANAYFDYRQGSLAHWFQFGAGLELLSKYCDFRANGYFPLEGTRVKRHTFEVGEGLFTKRSKFEYSYMGFNAELGWKAVRTPQFQLYLAGGTYYISGDSCSHKTWGGTFRIRPQYRDFLAVDLSMSDDSIFHLIYQIQVILSLPLYHTPTKGSKRPCGIYNREIYQPVERWDLITLRRKTFWESNF